MTRSVGKGVNAKTKQVVKQPSATTCSHHAITGLFLQSSFLTNCLPEKLLTQLGDLTNAPYMILFLLIVAAISQAYTLPTHMPEPFQTYVFAPCAAQCTP